MSTTKKQSSVRHTRAIQRDRTKRPALPPAAPQVEARLTDLIHPATYTQVAAFHAAGLRERILTLPVMVAFVLSLIWRHLGSVSEAVRVLRHEGFLWVQPTTVSQQALTQRLGSLPASLFAQVVQEVLPPLHTRHQARQRPLPPAVAWARQHFPAVLTLDGSTLDSLLRNTGLLRDLPTQPLAGRMAALVEVGTPVPHHVWFEDDPLAHDARFWDRALAVLAPGTLLLFDQGFVNYTHFDTLTDRGVSFIMASTKHIVSREERVLQQTATYRDRLIWLGARKEDRCRHRMRLVEVLVQGRWYRYLTNVLDPAVLPPPYVAALYAQRWRIEDAFNVVKRLLGLAYFWTGSSNGVQVQVWATWLLYAVLVDLTDAVADELGLPFRDISVEMVYRGLYHFTQAYHRGTATDPVCYLAAKATDLGIVKRQRKNRPSLEQLLGLTNPPDP